MRYSLREAAIREAGPRNPLEDARQSNNGHGAFMLRQQPENA